LLRSSFVASDWPTSRRELDLHLELRAGEGRRAGLESALRDAIRAGRLAPATVLPSSRALAGQLGVARGTVRAAYDQLAAEGYLVTRHGSGTRVAEVPAPRASAVAVACAGDSPQHDLRPGRPDPATFPAAAWLRATRRVLAGAPAEIHTLADPRGRPELRTTIAGYLGRARGVLASPDHIVITSGYSQALGLLARVLAESGASAVAMEDPGHPFHREIVRRAGLRILALPVDGRGARTDLLTGASFGDVAAVVVTPAHQYPAGTTLDPGRRRLLARWAQATNGLIIEDDYDGEFRYDRQPVGAVQGMAPGNTAYLGTASKTLAPALRLGWMVLPPHLAGPVAEAKLYADAQTAALSQLVLADLIATHVHDRHIRAARLRYRRRRDQLLTRLRAQAPQVQVSGIAAGLHAVAWLPSPGPSEAAVLSRAASHGLALQPLADHWQRAGDHPQGIVVGYSSPAEHAWPAALDTLTAVLRDPAATAG
jgi:GntR family transcriptional regulator / MocR family aminotransferase